MEFKKMKRFYKSAIDYAKEKYHLEVVEFLLKGKTEGKQLTITGDTESESHNESESDSESDDSSQKSESRSKNGDDDSSKSDSESD